MRVQELDGATPHRREGASASASTSSAFSPSLTKLIARVSMLSCASARPTGKMVVDSSTHSTLSWTPVRTPNPCTSLVICALLVSMLPAARGAAFVSATPGLGLVGVVTFL